MNPLGHDETLPVYAPSDSSHLYQDRSCPIQDIVPAIQPNVDSAPAAEPCLSPNTFALLQDYLNQTANNGSEMLKCAEEMRRVSRETTNV